jgi:hypothetical protein
VTTVSAEEEAWNEHVGWSKAANRLKARRTKSRSLVLYLTVVGAALQTLAGTVPWATVRVTAGIAGTIALAVVPILAGYFLKPEETRKWLRARSISEGIKSEVYTFCAGGAPYDGEAAPALLTAKYREIRDWGKDMVRERAIVGAQAAKAPGKLTTDEYLARRIHQQIEDYYLKKGEENAAMAERFRFAEVVLAALAAVLSAVATFVANDRSHTVYVGFQLGPWVAVLTTIGGSIAAYAAASRYDFQATTFYATAAQLKDLARDWSDSGATQPSQAWSTFVRRCEEVISAENRGWMAKLEPQSDTAAPDR